MTEDNITHDVVIADKDRQPCQLIIDIEWDSHKTGWAGASCACKGWAPDRVPMSRHNLQTIKEEALTAWKQGHRGDPFPHCRVQQYDGEIHTGQAHVTIDGDDYLWQALYTVMTKETLRMGGFYREVGLLEEASEYIIPIHRVKYVQSYPWWDLDDIWVREETTYTY